jgi:hypothetical protein
MDTSYIRRFLHVRLRYLTSYIHLHSSDCTYYSGQCLHIAIQLSLVMCNAVIYLKVLNYQIKFYLLKYQIIWTKIKHM